MNENVTQEFENDIGSWDWVEQAEKYVPATSAAELMEMTIEPKEFVVREILAPGLSMHDPIGNLEEGLEKHLNNFIEQKKDLKLIVIDTFQLARGTNRESNYPNDYADTQKLKKIADKHKVAILLVHHLRKMHDPDPVNMLSGSTGLSGGVAGNFVMYHAPQEEVMRLYCKCRSTKPRILELRFDETACVWEKLSDSRETENKLPPDLRVLLDFMQERLQFSGTNTALARVLAQRRGTEYSPKGLKQAMKRWEFVLQDCGITYRSHRSKGQRFVDVTYTPPEAGVTEVTQVTENMGA